MAPPPARSSRPLARQLTGLSLLAWICWHPHDGWAQTKGSIDGHVNDWDGLEVPSATVTFSVVRYSPVDAPEAHSATVVAIDTTFAGISPCVGTDVNGYFHLDSLWPGFYDISVSKVGFQTVEVKEVEVIAGSVTTRDITLELAEPQEPEEVAEWEVGSAIVGQVPTKELLKSIPTGSDPIRSGYPRDTAPPAGMGGLHGLVWFRERRNNVVSHTSAAGRQGVHSNLLFWTARSSKAELEPVRFVPLAMVIVHGEGFIQRQRTDRMGAFRFWLPPGTYDIIVTKPGFEAVQYASVTVSLDVETTQLVRLLRSAQASD